MSVQRDYLLKLIEEFFRILSGIIRHKKSGEYDKALNLIHQTALNFFQIELQNPLSIADEKIKALEEQKKELLSKLIKEKADILSMQQNTISALNHYEYALTLCQQVHQTSKDYSLDRINLMQEISKRILELS